ncbi:MAG: DUF4381 domain-containing protein [Gammaproteobacteria bacterium]|nr:DUF4381 domain-containing protein [Gammaproteobacteria bacterium]
MQPDLLQQLRDIHIPADPVWWPPAPGWWLLAVATLFGCVLAVRFAFRHYRRRRPIRRTRRLYQALHGRLSAGEITAESYVHQSNELLKRLLIHGLGIRAARPASNMDWLQILDKYHGGSAFSDGPGQVLGNERFRKSPAIQIEPLHQLLASFLAKVRP